ncbi:6-pyruvoyl trahydropterin synthase family protein [Hydrogenophaga laconesensis]|nr:6-carboxytetrahydropterin synthase [Hydrogenophaga laconesensis]
MYAVNVRDHFMIAHSFQGAVFGPAQRMHGATYVVDLELRRDSLDADGVVVDIGLATQVLRQTLAAFNFQNLDEMPEFKGHNTTTEFMARAIFDRVAACIATGELGANASGLRQMRVTLHESHVAWASYEGDLPA